jgi:hypothetical protein
MASVTRRYPKGNRTSRRVYSPEEWRKFLDGLDDRVVEADVLACHLDQHGVSYVGGVIVSAKVSEADPSWVYLGACFGERRLRELDYQRAVLAHVRGVAELCDPSFGHIAYGYAIHRTPLESHLAMIPDHELFKSRWRLRGYSWLTVCSQQVGDELGGVEALRATGAFVEVAKLGAGGYWLLATPRFEEYDLAAADRVFRVVASKLPPGRPIGLVSVRPDLSPPVLLVDQDAATVEHSADAM